MSSNADPSATLRDDKQVGLRHANRAEGFPDTPEPARPTLPRLIYTEEQTFPGTSRPM